jgi:hypothetical protein
MVKQINKKIGIITICALLVWCIACIALVRADTDINLILFYLLLFVPPSLLTLNFMLAINKATTNSTASRIFDTVTTIILVNFAVLFIVYTFTFSIG